MSMRAEKARMRAPPLAPAAIAAIGGGCVEVAVLMDWVLLLGEEMMGGVGRVVGGRIATMFCLAEASQLHCETEKFRRS
jgi:hypothetical protein